MKRYKALKIRIYPKAKQTEQLNKTLGCARAIYNLMLHERITVFEENKDDRQKLYGYTYKEVSAYKKEY